MGSLADLLASVDEAVKKADVVEISNDFAKYSAAVEPSDGFTLSCPPHNVTLRKYQLAAVEGILSTDATIIGLPPGLGKSITSLVAAAQLDGNTLIICPPSLIDTVWVEEIRNVYPDATIETVRGKKRKEIPPADFTIMGYAVANARQNDLRGPYSAVIIDEVHYCKNPTAQRTKAVTAITDKFRTQAKIIGLTGTLAVNDPSETFGPVRIAGKTKTINKSNKYSDWKRRWCLLSTFYVDTETKWGEKMSVPVEKVEGARDPEVLHERLRNTCYYRVERENVLDMPDKIEIVRKVYPSKKDLATYNKIEADFLKWIEETYDKDAAKRVSRAEKLVKINALSFAAGIAKIPFTTEYVESLVSEGEQVVVMAHHKEVVSELAAALKKAGLTVVTYVGDDNAKAKLKSYHDFKNNKADVLIGNIKAAGTGLNLENSNNLVFIQLPASAGDFEQAADRIYRLTQTKECNIHILNLGNDTVDYKTWQSLLRKRGMTTAVNVGDPVADLLDSI